MIRRGFAEGECQELFKGESIVNLVFQLRIEINVEPPLQNQAFKEQQGRIRIATFTAVTYRKGAH